MTNKTEKEQLINPIFEQHGYIQVYTGDGKGKTTASLDRIVYKSNMTKGDVEEAQKGWSIAKKAISEGEYQLVIMDEANIAIDLGMIELDDVLQTLRNKPDSVEVVLTGRRAKDEIIEVAHLVSEIKAVKHYWDKGINARSGIEY